MNLIELIMNWIDYYEFNWLLIDLIDYITLID